LNPLLNRGVCALKTRDRSIRKNPAPTRLLPDRGLPRK
jgi:hypothetical protein